MAKQKMDMLHGSLWDKLILYAFPVAATGILEQLFNASDLAIVGNFTGDAKTVCVAAVGANSPIVGLLLNLFIGIALGANVIIANAIGQKDEATIHKAVHTSIIMSILGGALIALIGEIFIGSLMHLMNIPDTVFPYALTYIRIYLLGMPVICLYNFEAAIFRSIGETKIPLQALAISGVLNVALCRTDHVIRIKRTEFKFDAGVAGRILRIGLPAGIQGAVFAVANIVIQSAINSLGTIVMAASSAALNIEIIVYDIMNSFSQACTTFTGQNYGAGDLKRCKKSLYLCIVEAAVACAVSIMLILFFGKSLLALFNSDPRVVEIGYTRLLIIFSAYTFSMLYENMSGYLRGFGLSLVPAILTVFGVCVVRLVWIYTVFPAHRTFTTIMLVYPLSLATTAVLIFIALMVYRPSKRYQK